MDILGRVKRLEREYGSRLDCPVCGGRGLRVSSWITEGQAVPVPEGCPACGEVMHIVVRMMRSANLSGSPGTGGEPVTGALFD